MIKYTTTVKKIADILGVPYNFESARIKGTSGQTYTLVT